MRTAAATALALLALCAAGAAGAGAWGPAGAACGRGDLPCFCAAAGGEWRALKSPLVPTCTVGLRHQGECVCAGGACAECFCSG